MLLPWSQGCASQHGPWASRVGQHGPLRLPGMGPRVPPWDALEHLAAGRHGGPGQPTVAPGPWGCFPGVLGGIPGLAGPRLCASWVLIGGLGLGSASLPRRVLLPSPWSPLLAPGLGALLVLSALVSASWLARACDQPGFLGAVSLWVHHPRAWLSLRILRAHPSPRGLFLPREGVPGAGSRAPCSQEAGWLLLGEGLCG